MRAGQDPEPEPEPEPESESEPEPAHADRWRRSGTFPIITTSFVTDRVRTAYYVCSSHLAESTLSMRRVNVSLSLHGLVTLVSKSVDLV